MKPVRDEDGPWVDIVDPVAKAADVEALIRSRKSSED
jgi:hypothetical protein